eukprot:GHRR01037894.1.p1 GENE.GHRR01037894.1~~GHRR01037894.1.p1  ORF type:complete len:103 (+),score=29.01 GHRR01037894.1:371-679(+)
MHACITLQNVALTIPGWLASVPKDQLLVITNRAKDVCMMLVPSSILNDALVLHIDSFCFNTLHRTSDTSTADTICQTGTIVTKAEQMRSLALGASNAQAAAG